MVELNEERVSTGQEAQPSRPIWCILKPARPGLIVHCNRAGYQTCRSALPPHRDSAQAVKYHTTRSFGSKPIAWHPAPLGTQAAG